MTGQLKMLYQLLSICSDDGLVIRTVSVDELIKYVTVNRKEQPKCLPHSISVLPAIWFIPQGQ